MVNSKLGKKMIRKSLVVAGLLFSNSVLIGSDFLNIGYGTGSVSYDNGSDDIKYKGIEFSLKRINSEYLSSISYTTVTADSDKMVIDNKSYKYDFDGSGISIDFAYKIIKKDEIFFAPYTSFNMTSFKHKFTRNSDGTKFEGTETSDNDLEVGFMVGYDYADDSFAYIDYSIDDDILESDDNDYNTLTVGVEHKLDKQFNINFSYSKDISNPDNQTSSSSMSFGFGYKFQ
jgi:hypothetical protein